MTDHRRDEFDRLLHGEGPADRARLAEALRTLREDLDEQPAPEVADAHLAAIAAAATEAAHELPAATVTGGARRWRARARRIAGLTAVKVAIGVGAAAAATGTGLAATGNLPEPVQRVVADVAERVGIELPAPSDGAEDPADDGGATTPDAPVGPASPMETAPPDEPGRPDDPGEGRGGPPSSRPTPSDPPAGPPSEVPGRGQPGTDPSERRPDDPGSGAGTRGDAPTEHPGERGRGTDGASSGDNGSATGGQGGTSPSEGEDGPVGGAVGVPVPTARPSGGSPADHATGSARTGQPGSVDGEAGGGSPTPPVPVDGNR